MTWLVVVALLALLGGVSTAAVTPGGRVRVYNRERASGTVPQLRQLLDEWERSGTHDVELPSYPPPGLRTDAGVQAQLEADGYSNAGDLSTTAHGRGAALDVWPVGFASYVTGSWEAVPPAMKAQFTAFGVFAESRGFTWGGRWRSSRMPHGDQPHVELKNWRNLPFPPPPGGYS